MKISAFASLLMVVLSSTAFAATSWQCSGDNIEGMEVSESNGHLEGTITWDCFPGGGICKQDATVEATTTSYGNTLFQGPYFKLIIETTKDEGANGYVGHITATDMTDARDMGQGLNIKEAVTCVLQ
jgi:hypothetical protein